MIIMAGVNILARICKCFPYQSFQTQVILPQVQAWFIKPSAYKPSALPYLACCIALAHYISIWK